MSSHLRLVWSERIKREQGRYGSKMYHVAPSSARSSIEHHGLDYSRADKGAPISGDGDVLPVGNYLYRELASAQDLLANVNGFDLWEVDVSGLALQDDPYEDWEAVYSPSPIPPNRLSRIASMGPYPDYPDGFVFSPPLYQSGFTLGQTVTINHPEMGGVEVQGEVVGEIAQTGIVVVQLPNIAGVVQVPLEMINEARLA